MFDIVGNLEDRFSSQYENMPTTIFTAVKNDKFQFTVEIDIFAQNIDCGQNSTASMQWF